MSITAPTAVLLVGMILFAGGFVNGAAGFGYGLVSMTSLAVVLDLQAAVVLMIIPIIAAEIGLVRELGREGFRRCSAGFGHSSSLPPEEPCLEWCCFHGYQPVHSRS